MTDQNNAAQAAEQTIRRVLEPYAESYDMMTRMAEREGQRPTVSTTAVAVDIRGNMIPGLIEALSKLRAEGVQAGDERAALEWYAEQVAGCRKMGADGDAARQALDKDGGNLARAALASAPVAGKAESQRATLMQAIGEAAAKAGIIKADWHSLSGPECLMLLDDLAHAAAPQASEAVRNALWTLTEHNALHFGEQHNTVIQGRAALKTQADQDGGPTDAQCKEAAAIARSFSGRAMADALDGGDCAKGAGDRQQKYWLCCGSTDPYHGNRYAPDCYKPSRAMWGTADQHSKDARAALSPTEPTEQGERDGSQ